MKILDPHLKDGIHDWRDGRRFYKEGDKLYVEGTTTLAGRLVPLVTSITHVMTDLQRYHPRQMCTQLCALHGLLHQRSHQMCNLQPRSVNTRAYPVNFAYATSRCLGIENQKGTLRAGADADLVVLDPNGNVLSTWVKGRIVWGRI